MTGPKGIRVSPSPWRSVLGRASPGISFIGWGQKYHLPWNMNQGAHNPPKLADFLGPQGEIPTQKRTNMKEEEMRNQEPEFWSHHLRPQDEDRLYHEPR